MTTKTTADSTVGNTREWSSYDSLRIK